MTLSNFNCKSVSYEHNIVVRNVGSFSNRSDCIYRALPRGNKTTSHPLTSSKTPDDMNIHI